MCYRVHQRCGTWISDPSRKRALASYRCHLATRRCVATDACALTNRRQDRTADLDRNGAASCGAANATTLVGLPLETATHWRTRGNVAGAMLPLDASRGAEAADNS